jgi:hypothetical protein
MEAAMEDAVSARNETLTQEEAVEQFLPATARRAGAAPSLEEVPTAAPPARPSAEDRRHRRHGGMTAIAVIQGLRPGMSAYAEWRSRRPQCALA